MRKSSGRVVFLLSMLLVLGLTPFVAGHVQAARNASSAHAPGHITVTSHTLVKRTQVKPASSSSAGGTNFGIITQPADGTSYAFSLAFTDDNNPTVAQLSATINWGDGTSDTSTGALQLTGSNGSYSLSGSHTWVDEGSYTVTVTITDTFGSTAVSTYQYTVSEGDLAVNNTAVSFTEGSTTAGTVLTFTDGAGGETNNPYTASVNWGDGTTETGTVSLSGGVYSVAVPASGHSYADEGSQIAVVTVNETNVPQTPLFVSHVGVTVTEGDAFTTAMNLTTAVEGTAVNGTVATFTDTGYPANTIADFTATINWGDGTTTAGTLGGGSGSPITVSGSHTYTDELATNTVTVSLFEDTAGTTTAIATASGPAPVTEGDVITGQALSITGATEGQAVTGAVATFPDTGYPTNVASDFSAVINWGDGSSDTVTSANGGITMSGGTLTVNAPTGGHTYADELAANTVTVTLSDDTPGTLVSTATGSVPVAEGDTLTPTGVTLSGTENAALSNVKLATFSDTGYLTNVAADFTAAVTWGDGSSDTSPTNVTISGPVNGVFTVSGTHTYGQDHSFPIAVTLTDNAPGTATATANSTANIAEDLATFTVSVPNLSATEGTAVTGQVATFTDGGTTPSNDPAGEYTATINWGDGTTTAGTVAAGSGAGNYVVNASGVGHTYADELTGGQIQVTVTETSAVAPVPAQATGSGTLTVAEGDAFTTAMNLTTAVEGTAVNGTVATFTDTGYPANTIADFTATINWGDGTTTAGTLGGGSGSPITVSGSHTYTDELATNTVTVSLFEDTAGTTTAIATASGPAPVTEGDALSGSLASISPAYQTPFNGTVATFTETGTYTGNPASDFTATINWGDGTTTAGTVGGPAGGPYTVSGSHTYAIVGVQANNMVVTINDDAPSTGTWNVSGLVTVVKARSQTTLTASPNPAALNQNVTFTATVGPVPPGGGVPTGTVTFTNLTTNTVVCNNVALATVAGKQVAACTTSFASPGNYTFQASYSGDGNFLASTSNQVVEAVSTCTITGSINTAFRSLGYAFSLDVSGRPGFPFNDMKFSAPDSSQFAGSFVAQTGSVAITSCSLPGQPGASATVTAVVRSGYGQFKPGDVITVALTGNPVTKIVISVTRNNVVIFTYSPLNAPYYQGKISILAS